MLRLIKSIFDNINCKYEKSLTNNKPNYGEKIKLLVLNVLYIIQNIYINYIQN